MTKYTYSEWIDHDGNGMPVGPDVLVAVKFRDGFDWYEDFPLCADNWHSNISPNFSNWHSLNDDDDALITAYRIATPINEQETIDED